MVARLAVVGVGRWGRNHVRVLKELEAEGIAELVALVDVDESRCREVASTFSVDRCLTRVDDLERLGVDGAVVATPISELEPVAMKLLSMGISVLVEKPVSTTPRGAEAIRDEARRRGLVAVPGFIMRFNPVVQRLRELVERNGFVYAIFRRLSRRPEHARRFSILLDLTIHDIDLCRYVMGLRRPVVEKALIARADVDDMVVAVLREGDARCLIHTDGVSLAKIREIELIGLRTFVRANTDDMVITVRRPDRSYIEEKLVGEEPLKAEDRAFIDVLEGKSVEVPTMDDAVAALEIVSAIEEAGRVDRERREAL